MNVDRRALLGETPGRAGMIEMNVTEKNVANVVRRETRGAHRRWKYSRRLPLRPCRKARCRR